MFSIPEPVAECLATLRRGGFAAYPVGGCVRDLLLGRDPAIGISPPPRPPRPSWHCLKDRSHRSEAWDRHRFAGRGEHGGDYLSR